MAESETITGVGIPKELSSRSPDRSTLTFLFLLIIMAVMGCSSEPDASQIANPASEYCAEQGGTVDIREDADGGQVGYCQFDDGSECEEWAFFRGECQPGDNE